MKLCLSIVLLFPAVSFAQDKPPDPEVDPKAVNAAIDKGLQWLLGKFSQNVIHEQKYTELVLLTLVHAGLPPEHPLVRDNFQKMLDHSNLSDTYNAGLRALLLEKVNRKYYQQSLAEIAQFFVENQCENGQWAYKGHSRKLTPTIYAPVPTVAKKKVIPGATQTMDEGPPPGKAIKLPAPVRTPPKKTGDNSNSQYAVLALFAASRAAVTVPKNPWQEIERWFESKQNADGGWGYDSAEVPGMGLVTTDTSSGSMTTAALTALIVSKFYLGKDWKTEASVTKGTDWLGKYFSVSTNPGGSPLWQFYYLYGLERVGTISGLEELGGHRWYKEGAEYLIKTQAPDGSWKSLTPLAGALTDQVTDTCFAILFLKRATPPLQKPKDIATGVAKKAEDPGAAEEKEKK
ncbi:MAG TPA: prenyltransferase/squalene oxidase repeat-containing protein [Planctomycetota bacterium]|nr:prenyltransferase/squalene oxidase repeat-containing protein [Planctomycetota bacterium]